MKSDESKQYFSKTPKEQEPHNFAKQILTQLQKTQTQMLQPNQAITPIPTSHLLMPTQHVIKLKNWPRKNNNKKPSQILLDNLSQILKFDEINSSDIIASN